MALSYDVMATGLKRLGSVGRTRKVSTQSLKSEKSDEDQQQQQPQQQQQQQVEQPQDDEMLGDEAQESPDPLESDDQDYSTCMPWIKVCSSRLWIYRVDAGILRCQLCQQVLST